MTQDMNIEHKDHLLSQQDSSSSNRSSEDENRHHDGEYAVSPETHQKNKIHRAVTIFLQASVLISLASMMWGVMSHWPFTDKRWFDDASGIASKYAGLYRDVPTAWNPYGPFGTGTTSERARSLLWESLNVSPGSVSIPKAQAAAWGLPEAQDFPWDPSRSLYLLNGHHSMHCMRKIRRFVTIAHHGGEQLDTYAHLVHCMDHLLQNIMCEADDTPMYTTAGKRKDAGYQQLRMCRDWSKLDAWAGKMTSCYVFTNETEGVSSSFERYKFCPAGSEYEREKNGYLGMPEAWHERVPQEIESMYPYWEDFKDDRFVFHEVEDVT